MAMPALAPETRTLSFIFWTALFAGLAACTEPDVAKLFATKPVAPSFREADVAALEHLGAKRTDRGTSFNVYSENAERMHVLLFDDPEAALPTRELPMSKVGDVWSLYVEGVGLGQHYGYVAWGPNWRYDPEWRPGSMAGFVADVDEHGNRFNPNKLLIDPYTRVFHRDHDWMKGSLASGPSRSQSTWSAASKAVVVESQYAWSAAHQAFRTARMNGQGIPPNELVAYEVHVKGATASAASGVSRPGTYRGFGELADYFDDLGVNAVELLPIHEKPLDGGYWGYQTIGFFAPERTYASATEPVEIIDEFKAMVDAYHQRGIEVWLDVVYNHTGEGGLWRENRFADDRVYDNHYIDSKEVVGLYNFRGLDNQAYYALSPDKQTYWNNTGVGNQTRTNHVPFRRLILDSLRYWVVEMGIDGFRFDLAPVLGAVDGDYNAWDGTTSVLNDIVDDPVLRAYGTRIIAEPWAVGGDYGFKLGGFPAAKDGSGVGWYEWSSRFRDVWRTFLNFDDWRLSSRDGPADIGYLLAGHSEEFSWNGRKPYHAVNFATVHDGFPLYDVFSFGAKLNGCGPLNPICCDDPLNEFCDRDSGSTDNRSRDWGGANEAMKRQLMRNAFVAMMISRGTPMLYGGDEWIRTQYGNNNAYSTGADNPFNWFDWGAWKPNLERQRMHDFVRQVIALRQAHPQAFAPTEFGGGAPFAWKNAANQDMQPADWNGRHVAQHYWDPSFGGELFIMINLERTPVAFTLPAGRDWVRRIDTQSYFDDAAYFAESGRATTQSGNAFFDVPAPVDTEYTVPGSTIVILEAE